MRGDGEEQEKERKSGERACASGQREKESKRSNEEGKERGAIKETKRDKRERSSTEFQTFAGLLLSKAFDTAHS